MTVINLFDGQQLASWLIAEDDEVIQVVIFQNDVTLSFPKDAFPELALEMVKVAEALKLREHRN